jgi:hypothetical protein
MDPQNIAGTGTRRATGTDRNHEVIPGEQDVERLDDRFADNVSGDGADETILADHVDDVELDEAADHVVEDSIHDVDRQPSVHELHARLGARGGRREAGDRRTDDCRPPALS